MNSLKLNLGCWAGRPKGWINTDSSINANLQKIPIVGKRISNLFNPIGYSDTNLMYMNLNKSWKYSDDSVDIVYASHLFEHLSLSSARFFLTESLRVLKPGGVIRIVVRDLYERSGKHWMGRG